ncbi:MAG TPA: amidohydrolase family protein [Candidatus Binataceae bacterium]|nr:amidohydrolase family protein [Candidatus Binataceae bacterium]
MPAEKADLVLHEGAVFGHPESDSVAVADGRIIAHARFAELKPLVGPRTHLIRLAGRTIAPGFIDCHLHFMEGASAATGVSVFRCRTIGDLLADLRVAAGKAPPGNWLRAFGCDEALMRDRRGPTRAELDQSVTRNPLRLRHQTLHGSWLNSRAIATLGLEAPGFTPPAGATLERDATGRLTGLVAGMEQWLSARLPLVTAAELESRARLFSRELAAAGITAFTDATVRNAPDDLAMFARLAGVGAICQRTAAMIGQDHRDALGEARRVAEAAGIRLAGVKFMGVERSDPPRLARRVADALGQGIDVAFHATEVDELEAALIAIAAAHRDVSLKSATGAICRIEHGGLIPPDYPERIAALGAWVVCNPGFLYYRGAKYAADPGLVPYLYRARSLAAAGVAIAAGTDAPVTPPRPLMAIAAAVTRLSIDGDELAPAEKISLAEAFALFTTQASRLSRLGAGEIAPGRLADLIVLPADPLALTPAELHNLAVDMTIVGGRAVYERGRPAVANSDIANLYSP